LSFCCLLFVWIRISAQKCQQYLDMYKSLATRCEPIDFLDDGSDELFVGRCVKFHVFDAMISLRKAQKNKCQTLRQKKLFRWVSENKTFPISSWRWFVRMKVGLECVNKRRFFVIVQVEVVDATDMYFRVDVRCHWQMLSWWCHWHVLSVDATGKCFQLMPLTNAFSWCHWQMLSVDATDKCFQLMPLTNAFS